MNWQLRLLSGNLSFSMSPNQWTKEGVTVLGWSDQVCWPLSVAIQHRLGRLGLELRGFSKASVSNVLCPKKTGGARGEAGRERLEGRRDLFPASYSCQHLSSTGRRQRHIVSLGTHDSHEEPPQGPGCQPGSALSEVPAAPALAKRTPVRGSRQLSDTLRGLSTTAWHLLSLLNSHAVASSHTPLCGSSFSVQLPGSAIATFSFSFSHLKGSSCFQSTNFWVGSPSRVVLFFQAIASIESPPYKIPSVVSVFLTGPDRYWHIFYKLLTKYLKTYRQNKNIWCLWTFLLLTWVFKNVKPLPESTLFLSLESMKLQYPLGSHNYMSVYQEVFCPASGLLSPNTETGYIAPPRVLRAETKHII